jgi:hypothetical protein
MPPLSIAYIMEQWVVANQQERDTCCPAARVLLGLWAYCEAASGIYFYVRTLHKPPWDSWPSGAALLFPVFNKQPFTFCEYDMAL